MGTPDPLTPPDCDLRGLPFMPLDVVRVVDSDLFALSNGEEFKSAVTLWCKSWLQLPAGSLPTNDKVLAHLSGSGPRWRKVKEVALRGWIVCSDGRFYHPVVAEKANDAWERRGEWQEKQDHKNERQRRWRDRVKTISGELRDLGVTPPMNASLSTLERLLVDAQTSTGASHVDLHVDATETAKTGTGTGTGTGTEERKSSDAAKNRGHRLAPDFEMPEDWRAWAMTERHWSRIDAGTEAANFVDFWHAKTGKDATKIDWEATWRNWVRNSRRLSSVPPKPNDDDIMPRFA